jgi:sarcosine oxidase
LQPEGGYLLAERAVVAFVEGARRRGARVRSGTAVRAWRTGGGAVEVETDSGVDRAAALVIAAGAWAAKLLPALADVARPERQVVGWFRPRRPELFEAGRFPVFDILFEEGNFYGLPASGQPGFKLGRHGHLHESADPDQVDRAIHPRDEAVLRGALARYFPDGDGDAVALSTCLFTNSPDQHFIVDRISDAPPVVVAAGFSGHGFKFAPVIGEILADLATTGRSPLSIERFRLGRFDATVRPAAS